MRQQIIQRKRTMKHNYASILILLFLLLTTGFGPGRTPRQVPIVDANAITTPSATWLPSLLPTPTFTPEPVRTDAPGAAPVSGGYHVQNGDSVKTVAIELGVDLFDLPCAVDPEFRITDPLVIGDVLVAAAPGITCYEVQLGDTLESVAIRQNVAVERIRALLWNRLDLVASDDEQLPVGAHLRIPPTVADATQSAGFLSYMLDQPLDTSPFVGYAVGGPGIRGPQTGSVPPEWPFGSGQFSWPLYGWLSQGYRYDHRAIDIAAPSGTLVTASDRGVVVRSGWNDQGYGLFVVIDHNIDFVTLYAHLAEALVGEGDVIAAGQVIGTVGSTGNSTGPHLHFEIRDFGRRANPLELINR